MHLPHRWPALAGSLLALSVLLGACASPAQPTPTPAPAAPKPTTVAAAPAAAAPSTAGATISVTGPLADEARSLNAAGATFPAPLYAKWFEEYARLTGVQVNYQAIGSGGGVKGIQDQTIDFGASDAPMTDEQIAGARGGHILHIPTALGAIVPIYNIPGVSTKLKFTGATLAGIFAGDISRWNDPKLLADNPALANVNQDIVVVHRSDGSGTTFGFTDYLSAVSPEWAAKVGKNTSVNWPTGLGGSGNAGVAGEVQQNPGSIGYVELIYALQNNMSVGQVKNREGQWVDPSLESVTAAAANSLQTIPADLRFSIVDAPGAASYPISTATWLLVPQTMTNEAKATAIARVLWWATHDGQKLNNTLEYATVPDGLTAKSEQFIRSITVNGKPALVSQ
jgi:phosphate transport system substrate-binding protein